jgi:hypothetical protein
LVGLDNWFGWSAWLPLGTVVMLDSLADGLLGRFSRPAYGAPLYYKPKSTSSRNLRGLRHYRAHCANMLFGLFTGFKYIESYYARTSPRPYFGDLMMTSDSEIT